MMDSRRSVLCALTIMNYPHKCTPYELHLHHLINFSKAVGNKKVRKILKSNPEELTDWVCAGANIGRIADEKGAQAVLFEKKVSDLGYEHMNAYLADLPWKVKRPELTLKALLG